MTRANAFYFFNRFLDIYWHFGNTSSTFAALLLALAAAAKPDEVVRMFALKLPPEIDERLEALARRTGRSKAYYAQEAILEHLEDLEDLYLAETAAEEHFRSGGQTIPMTEIMEAYGE